MSLYNYYLGKLISGHKKLEGEPAETDDSGYDGLAYIYPKTYNGKDGYIYYMFDDKEKLVSLLWVYETPDSKDAKEVYEKSTVRLKKNWEKVVFSIIPKNSLIQGHLEMCGT